LLSRRDFGGVEGDNGAAVFVLKAQPVGHSGHKLRLATQHFYNGPFLPPMVLVPQQIINGAFCFAGPVL